MSVEVPDGRPQLPAGSAGRPGLAVRLGRRLAGRHRPAAAAWRMVALMVGLGILSGAVPAPLGPLIRLLMVIVGVAAMIVGIRWHRPVPAVGWWTLAFGAIASLVALLTIVVTVGIPDQSLGTSENPLTIGPTATALFAVAYLSTFIGLALIGRAGTRRSGWVDLIDALVVGAALFPLMWALVLDPLLQMEGFAQPATLIVPTTCMLIVVLAVKLVLSVGLRWSTGWLLAAAAALFSVNILGLVPVLFDVQPPILLLPFLWALYPVALGGAALHPSIVAVGAPQARPDANLSVPRVLLIGALALFVPFAFIFQDVFLGDDPLQNRADAVALVGPVVVVALLLVVRLAVAARVAQRRADDLALQAYALDVAMREQEALRQQLTYRALHDPLTGLANRVVLAERLEWTLTRRVGSGRHALFLLDLDGFKDVNDTLGHQVGDDLLIAAAHRVLALLPEGGMLARLGGDEFAALLEDTTPEEASAWTGRVLEAIRRPFEVGGRQLYLTTSIGLALLNAADDQTSRSSALRDADLALYAAKAGGKDQMRMFQPEMVEARLTHSRLSAGLRRALANDELRVHYQPLVDLTTGQIRAVEALLRWTPPGGQPVPPDEFIPVAEETGLISEIGAWVLRRACAEAHSWYTTRGVSVAVNISGRQLVEPGFAGAVLETLSTAGLPGEALIIEVTETSMIATAKVDRAIRQLARLREHGVRVAIDDFGTGYSSLSYLSQLPVDILKMDSSFTRHGAQLAFGPEDWPFARAIMDLGEGLRLTTVAEGIETAEQADALRQLNCHLAQGFLFSRPVPAEAIDELLAMPVSTNQGTRPGSASG